jgi:hypothetical protein
MIAVRSGLRISAHVALTLGVALLLVLLAFSAPVSAASRGEFHRAIFD